MVSDVPEQNIRTDDLRAGGRYDSKSMFLFSMLDKENSSGEARKYHKVEITVLIEVQQCKSVFLCHKTL